MELYRNTINFFLGIFASLLIANISWGQSQEIYYSEDVEMQMRFEEDPKFNQHLQADFEQKIKDQQSIEKIRQQKANDKIANEQARIRFIENKNKNKTDKSQTYKNYRKQYLKNYYANWKKQESERKKYLAQRQAQRMKTRNEKIARRDEGLKQLSRLPASVLSELKTRERVDKKKRKF